MNPAQRDAYLNALGIQQWVPRDWDIDEAVDTPAETVPTSTATATATAPVETEAKAESAGAALAALTESSQPEARQPEAEPSTTEPPPVEPVSQVEPPRFRLLATLLAGQCLVINDTPHTETNGWSQAHNRLLSNILLALDVDPQSMQHTPFNWPMFHNSPIDQGEAVASDAVQSFVKAQLQAQGQAQGQTQDIKFILLMGDTAARYMGVAEAFKQARGTLQAFQNTPLCMTHSVDLLLRLPQMKREVWQDLQVLVKH